MSQFNINETQDLLQQLHIFKKQHSVIQDTSADNLKPKSMSNVTLELGMLMNTF